MRLGVALARTEMIAGYLRAHARRRIEIIDEGDCGRNARAAVALIDAAVYAALLDPQDRIVRRLAEAGCFAGGSFDPGAEVELIVRCYGTVREAGPARLLEAVACAAERAAAHGGLARRPGERGAARPAVSAGERPSARRPGGGAPGDDRRRAGLSGTDRG